MRKQAKQWRLNNGLTQAEMAAKLSISQPMWNMMERGRRPITEDVKASLCEFIEFYEEEQEEEREELFDKIELLSVNDKLLLEIMADRMLK